MSNDQPQEEAKESTYPENEIQRAGAAINDMTPEEYLSLESTINTYAESNAIPEAGGIAFTEFEGEHGGVLHVTARAPHPTRAVQMVLESLDYLRSLQPNVKWRIPGGKAPAPAPPAAPAQTAQQAPLPSGDPGEPQYVDVQTGESAPAPPAAGWAGGQAQQVMVITKIEITPKPDARVDVFLYAPGHRFPDLRINNWTAQSVLENIFAPNTGWDLAKLQAAGEYVGNWNVTWENSTRLNTKGVPYKDVKEIAAA